MRRLLLLACAVMACDGSVTDPPAKPSLLDGTATTCTPTTFERDGRPLTAAVIGTSVPIARAIIDATGCDIGIYYGPGTTGSVDQSSIAGASYFGVVNDGGAVDVTRSSVSNIGDRPFSGAQHGNAIFYTTEHVQNTPTGSATGTISGNSVSLYQKGGIIVRGLNASANIVNNTVTGLGPVDFIAQNGIQVSSGATGVVRENDISDNNYTPPGTISCGILLFDATGVKVLLNTYEDDEANLCNFGKGGGNASE